MNSKSSFYFNKTGSLTVSAPLDYKLVPSYLLTISAYNVAKPDHITNTTVRIDIDVNNFLLLLLLSE